jgi:flagellar basal-body rod modification protein FlgD
MNVVPIPASILANTKATTGSAAPINSTTSNPIQSTQSMFMQLLVAQLQNQSPLDPVDPTTFTSQLVQFNMLDQLSQINNTLTNAFGTTPPAGTTATAGTTNSVQGAQ